MRGAYALEKFSTKLQAEINLKMISCEEIFLTFTMVRAWGMGGLIIHQTLIIVVAWCRFPPV